MSHKTAIEPGSLVVVSGANGNIASHVIDQLIKAGYRVRGTVRDKKKQEWLLDFFNDRYGPGNIELVEVPDMTAKGAFDDAVKGASGFIHTATPVMQSTDPNKAIPVVVDGTINFLEAAATEPGIKRVVLTSSSGAATSPKPGERFSIDSKTWNEEAVKEAWAPPPYEGLQRTMNVYFAGKTQGEQAAWKWMKEHSPEFVLNTVLPNCNLGPVLSKEHQGLHSTLGWFQAAWDGFEGHEDDKNQPPQYYINIVDDAIVHVASLIYDDVRSERLFAFAHPFNWNDILSILRKLYPERRFIDDIPNLGRDLSKVSNERAEELLERMTGHGWTDLQDTAKQGVSSFL